MSAYEGNVGDWALGKWEGYTFPEYVGARLSSIPRSIVVERSAGGKVGCRWVAPADPPTVGWVPRCRIKATSIYLVTKLNSEVELDRVGEGLEGRLRSSTSSRSIVQLKRVQ